MKTGLSITFVDENNVRYEREFEGMAVGQKIKAKLRFPVPISSFEVHIKAIRQDESEKI